MHVNDALISKLLLFWLRSLSFQGRPENTYNFKICTWRKDCSLSAIFHSGGLEDGVGGFRDKDVLFGKAVIISSKTFVDVACENGFALVENLATGHFLVHTGSGLLCWNFPWLFSEFPCRIGGAFSWPCLPETTPTLFKIEFGRVSRASLDDEVSLSFGCLLIVFTGLIFSSASSKSMTRLQLSAGTACGTLSLFNLGIFMPAWFVAAINAWVLFLDIKKNPNITRIIVSTTLTKWP